MAGKSMATKNFRRRNFFIDKQFQSRFILKFCGLVAMGSGLTILMLYLLAKQSTTVAFVKTHVTVMTTADFIFPLLVQTVLVVTLLVGVGAILVTLFVSHKIAGPLFRFRQTLRELAAGDFSDQIRLRKEDQLQEIASEFNHMIASVSVQAQKARGILGQLKNDIDMIGEFNVEDAKRKSFLELKQKAQELERVLNFFRS